MQTLIDLLSHRYLVLNRVAESVFDVPAPACHQRLRSRVQRRHRFAVEDYKTIRKEVLAFSRRLDRMAGKLEAAQASDKPADWKALMHHPWLNLKEVLVDAGAPLGLGYAQAYDRLRLRAAPPEVLIRGVAATCRDFAAWLRAQLEAAQVERKTYVFSAGRGGASHRRGAGKK
ncbi:MAG: hypothetical protein D6722_14320 [Bacteroidetes bacterium]|nr:MAG: hypothetical protein D6722_14320 [Bacteroidota bacterium]